MLIRDYLYSDSAAPARLFEKFVETFVEAA